MIRVLVVCADPVIRESLRSAISESPDMETAGLARDGQEAVQMAQAHSPNIVLVSWDLPVFDGLQTTEFLSHSAPKSAVILVSGAFADCRRAMRAGARDHLVWPCSAPDLIDAVRAVAAEQQRRHTDAFARESDPHRMCRVFAVSGAKGGVGKTTVATNLAVALHLETGEPTTMIDLYTQFGDVSMLLNITPKRSLADLARQHSADVDGALLQDHLELHDSGLNVLIGAVSPVALDAITAPFLDRMIGFLKQTNRFVVLDVPPILHPTTLHALSHASLTLLVANLFDLTTIKDTRLLLQAISGHYVAANSVRLVLNRVSRRNRLQTSDIEETLGLPVAVHVPNDGRIVPDSINRGIPFILSHPKSSIAQAVRTFACQLACERSTSETGSAWPHGGVQ